MYGLIGKKLGHSFSANFFNEKFKKEEIDESYHLFPIHDIDALPGLIITHPELKGLNVTIPYKTEVLPFLADISEEAKEIGAVNVLKIKREKNTFLLKGYNTDCYGFRTSLLPLLTREISKALVLGTGGASKAVNYVLTKLGIDVTFVSRNPCKGQLSYSEVSEEVMKQNLLIVNTTPLGTFPDIEEYPSIPYQFLTPEHVCYDLVYNPLITTFMKKSREMGAKVKNGMEMLRLQAIASWDIWTDTGELMKL